MLSIDEREASRTLGNIPFSPTNMHVGNEKILLVRMVPLIAPEAFLAAGAFAFTFQVLPKVAIKWSHHDFFQFLISIAY